MHLIVQSVLYSEKYGNTCILEPVLFDKIIRDLTFSMTSGITKFDIKWFRVIKTIKDCKELQRDLCRLVEQVSKLQMLFNGSKCKNDAHWYQKSNYSYILMGSSKQ